MADTLRLYFEAALAVAVMVTLSVISGFLAAAVTSDRAAIAITMAVVFAVVGAVLLVRVWLVTPKPAASIKPDM